MRKYDHHDPDCNTEQWAEEMQCRADRIRRHVTEEELLKSVE